MKNDENQKEILKFVRSKLDMAIFYSDFHLGKFKEYEKQAIELKELIHTMTEKSPEDIP